VIVCFHVFGIVRPAVDRQVRGKTLRPAKMAQRGDKDTPDCRFDENDAGGLCRRKLRYNKDLHLATGIPTRWHGFCIDRQVYDSMRDWLKRNTDMIVVGCHGKARKGRSS
jgi:hypothetical protein